jgi:hypothetical protein
MAGTMFSLIITKMILLPFLYFCSILWPFTLSTRRKNTKSECVSIYFGKEHNFKGKTLVNKNLRKIQYAGYFAK